jgi:transposase-like protein
MRFHKAGRIEAQLALPSCSGVEQAVSPHLKATHKSRRVDETYIKVKCQETYLYRAVDTTGQTIDFPAHS